MNDASKVAGSRSKMLVPSSTASSSAISISKPKTPLELERDWRRLPTTEDKYRYLCVVGCKRTTKLLDKDGHGELLEDMLVVIMKHSMQMNLEDESSTTSGNEASVEDGNNKFAVEDTVQWLQGFSTMKCFSLGILFVNSPLRNKILAWLQHYYNDSVAGSEPSNDSPQSKLAASYRC
jgi:hypothetical protein